MSVKAVMATILQDQMTSRGISSLSRSAYEEIVELLIEQLRELEFGLARREIRKLLDGIGMSSVRSRRSSTRAFEGIRSIFRHLALRAGKHFSPIP
jgi:hypothetical protein